MGITTQWPMSGDRLSKKGQPAWEIAYLYPPQGTWSEDEYLALDLKGGRLIELANGFLEVLSMPTLPHQRIVKALYRKLDDFVSDAGLGDVFFAPLPVHLKAGTYREPDILFVQAGRVSDDADYPEGADLVIEVVSSGEANRKRDLETKRREYAAAGIGEYWIVDPAEKVITVLRLRGKSYRIHGKFGVGQSATSAMLNGFRIDVKWLFQTAKESKR